MRGIRRGGALPIIRGFRSDSDSFPQLTSLNGRKI